MDRGDYIFGGFVITQPVDRPAGMSAELLPARILTASPCIADFVPDAWALSWTGETREVRESTAQRLGIDRSRLDALISHATRASDRGELGWPYIVNTLDAARALLALLPAERDWRVVGLALHRRHRQALMDALKPETGAGPCGLLEVISQGHSLEAGTVLGFEPLCFDGSGAPHSWLCNGLESTCYSELGVRPGELGLLQTNEDAARAVELISKDETGAEPGLWLPWLLLDYSAGSRSSS